METIEEYFARFPSQMKVANLLMEYGIRVQDGRAYCGEIEQGDSAIGRACSVDRRVVRTTLERISSEPELKSIFSKLKPMLSMADLAPEIGCTAMVITPTDARMPGILAGITDVLYKKGMSLRQAMVYDSGDRERSVLVVVVDGKIPSETIYALRSCRGVSSVLIRRLPSSKRLCAEPPWCRPVRIFCTQFQHTYQTVP